MLSKLESLIQVRWLTWEERCREAGIYSSHLAYPDAGECLALLRIGASQFISSKVLLGPADKIQMETETKLRLLRRLFHPEDARALRDSYMWILAHLIPCNISEADPRLESIRAILAKLAA